MRLFLPSSLKVAVPLLLLVFAALLSTVNLIYTVPQAERAVEDKAQVRLFQELSRLQGSLEHLLRKGDVAGVRREVAVLASNAEFAVVTLLDEKRVVIAATRRAWFGRPVQDVLPAFDIIQADKAVKRRRALVVMGPRQRSLFGYTGIPVGGEGEDLLPSRIGNLFVAYDLSRSKAEARAQILNQSLYWTGLVSALALLLWLIFHFMLTRRVEQLVKAAEQLTLGDLNARSGLSGLDELARLSQAFDAMAAEIADTQTRLRQDIAERIRVQQALEDSEARLQQILNNTTAVVYVKDSAGQYSLINRQHERLFHRKQAQVVGKTDAEIFPKEIADEFRRNDLRVLEKNAPIEFEETVPHDDGLHTYISLKFPLFNAAGETYAVCGISTDITERKHAEEALRVSEASYHAIFDAAEDAIFVLDLETGAIIDVNHKACAAYGYTREEMKKIAIETISSGKYPYTQEEAMKLIGRAIIGENLCFEWHRKNKDGSLHWDEMFLKRVGIGGQDRILALTREITERKAAEEALRASEEQYRGIFDTASDGFGVWRSDGTLVDVNPAMYRMHGYVSREEFMALDPRWYIHPQSHGQFQQFLQTLQTGRLFHCEGRDIRKNGEIFDVEIHGITFQYRGEPHLLSIVRDITERKRAAEERLQLEAQLRQAQKMEAIGHLTGGIAHDFNNILTSIVGYTVLAQGRQAVLEDMKLTKYLDQIYRSGERAQELIQQMLTFSRGQRGEPRPLSLPPLIKESLKLLHSTLPSSIEFHTEFEADGGPVMLDPIQLEQVLMNLCINARDAMDGHGTIAIAVRNRRRLDTVCASCRQNLMGDFVEFAVSDTGIGIAPEVLDRIFEPFFTTKEVGKGSGMGLATVHGIIHEHGGHLVVKTAPGQGAAFSVLLPPVEQPLADAEELEPDQSTVSAASGGVRGHVLVVDDEASVAEFMAELLESRGLKVTVSNASPKAYELLRRDPQTFDLVVTDQIMPKMTGLELARKLCELRPHLPVILYTGRGDEIIEDTIKACGIRGVLKKPIEIEALFELIRELLSQPQTTG